MGSSAAMGPTLQELVCGGTGAASDLSAPLSAADLQSCLDRITLHSDQVKDRVYKTITSHHKDFASMIRHANSTSTDVEDIEENMNAVLKLLQDDPGAAPDSQSSPPSSSSAVAIDRELCASAVELKHLRAELEEKQQAVQAVGVIAALHTRLVRLDSHAAAGDLRAAAAASVQLRDALRQTAPPHEENGSSSTAGPPLPLLPRIAALEFVQSEFQDRQEKLQLTLLALVEKSIVLDAKRRELVCHACVQLESAGKAKKKVALSDVWAAIEVLGLQGTASARLADSLFSGLVDPILRDPTVEVASEEGGSSDAPARLRWPSNRLSKVAMLTPAAVYSKLLPVVQFLSRHVACGDRPRLQTLGRMLWPRCADAIINGCLKKAIPSATSELAGFQTVAEETLRFESALAEEGFLPTPPPSPGPGPHQREGREGVPAGKLSTFVADVDVHFASKKRKDVLGRARALLVNSDFSSSLVPAELAEPMPVRELSMAADVVSEGTPSSSASEGASQKGPETRERARKRAAKVQQAQVQAQRKGTEEAAVVEAAGGKRGQPPLGGGLDRQEGAFFRMEPMHVSVSAQSLVSLAHEALQEACLSTTRTASELYKAARDALLLYRAVVPVKHAARLETVPLLALLFHNDCLFIAHAMLTLGLQYRKGLPPTLQPSASLVDMSPVFRGMATSTIDRQLAQQSANLIEMMESGGGFHGTHDEKRCRDVSRALQGSLHHLRQLAAVWKPVASWRTYVRLMATLIDASSAHFAGEITSMSDLSVEETVQLRALAQEFLQGLPPLLDPPGSPSAPPPQSSPRTSTDPSQPDPEPDATAVAADPSPASTPPRAEVLSLEDAQRNLEKSAPASKKLQRLSDLLDMSLVSITQAWESGDLISCGFSRKEVCNLVKAIFSDTPLRVRSLEMILSVDPFTSASPGSP